MGLKRLAFEAFQKHFGQDRATEAAGFSDTDRVAGIGLVAAHPQKFAELARFVQIDRIAETLQAASETEAGSGFDPDARKTTTPQPPKLFVEALNSRRARALLQDASGIVDDAKACGFDADVQASPDLATVRHSCSR